MASSVYSSYDTCYVAGHSVGDLGTHPAEHNGRKSDGIGHYRPDGEYDVGHPII